MIVRRCFKTNKVVAGGGATEMELSRALKEAATEVDGKEQLVMNMFAKSLEAIPKCIADNAGLDSLDVINKLRHRHGNFFLIQLKVEPKIFIWELTSTTESEILLKISFGSLQWSRSML